MTLIDELERLTKLQASGVLTSEEFTRAKSLLLTPGAQATAASQPLPVRVSVCTLKPATNNGARLPALMIDMGAIMAVLWLLSFVVPLAPSSADSLGMLAFGLYLLCRDAILPGGSLGKRICGLSLLDIRSGATLSPGLTIVRQFCCWVGMAATGAIVSGICIYIWGVPSSLDYPNRYLTGGCALFLCSQIGSGRTFCDRAANAILVLNRDRERLLSVETTA